MFPLMFVNCVIIVLAPLLVTFYFVIQKNSQLIILAMGSSFFFVLALLLSSLLWWTHFQWIIIPFTVTFQEAARFAFWWLYIRAFKQGSFKDDPTKPSDFMVALSFGWGYATTNVVLSFLSGLSHFTGPAFLPAPACTTVSVFYVLALIEVAFIAMHYCWSLLAFEGYNSRTWWVPVFVYLSHLLASMLTYALNSESAGSCLVGSISTTYIIMIAIIVVTAWRFHRANEMIEYIKTE